MKPKKMDLSAIKNRLSRDEMKMILAGSEEDDYGACTDSCGPTQPCQSDRYCRSGTSNACPGVTFKSCFLTP